MQNISRKILTLPLRLAIITIIFGALFKIMHWPYGHELIVLGSLAVMMLYTIRFFYKNEKTRLDYVKFGFVILWVFSYFNQVLHLLNIPFVFQIAQAILFVWWLIEEGFSYFTNRKLKPNKALKIFYYLLIGISNTFIICGLLFKISHWPYGNILFTCGILTLSVLLIVDYFAIKR